MTDYSKVKPISDCMECWPKLCRCKCPHGTWMNMECAQCNRYWAESTIKRQGREGG